MNGMELSNKAQLTLTQYFLVWNQQQKWGIMQNLLITIALSHVSQPIIQYSRPPADTPRSKNTVKCLVNKRPNFL
jgi:hypothetical protein